jgi:hypothetical protein
MRILKPAPGARDSSRFNVTMKQISSHLKGVNAGAPAAAYMLFMYFFNTVKYLRAIFCSPRTLGCVPSLVSVLTL